MIEGLLTKHAMGDLQKLFNDPPASRKMVDGALRSWAGRQHERRPHRSVASSASSTRSSAPPPAANGREGGLETGRDLEGRRYSRARRPTNGFDITFPQGVMWGIIGCVMSFAIGLVSERVRGTFVRLQMAPLTRAQILAGKALACFRVDQRSADRVCSRSGVGVLRHPDSSLPASRGRLRVRVSLGFVGFMMMIAGLGRTEQAAAGAGWAMLMPMTMFGGGMMPQFVMPPWMQTVGNLSPVKWAILGIRRRGVARLHLDRDAAALRHPARVRRSLFRRWRPRTARGVSIRGRRNTSDRDTEKWARKDAMNNIEMHDHQVDLRSGTSRHRRCPSIEASWVRASVVSFCRRSASLDLRGLCVSGPRRC